MKIEISGDLLKRCHWVSTARQSNRKHSRDYALGAAQDGTGLPGAISEVAFHLYLGVPLDWEFLATDAGFCKPDVGGWWEVRSTVKPGNRLNLFEREITPSKLAAPFAWIYVEDHLSDAPTCHLLGWATGCEIVRHGVPQIIQRGPCYYLDNRLLHAFAVQTIDKRMYKGSDSAPGSSVHDATDQRRLPGSDGSPPGFVG